MNRIRRIAVALVAASIIALAGASNTSAKTEHCPEPSVTGHIENGSMDNDLVLPAGTVACVKGSTDAVSFTADGVTDLFTYLGNGHDVSYYVIYQYPEVTPSPTPTPSSEPTPEPSSTPSPTVEPTPSPSAEPSPTASPSTAPSPSTPVSTSSPAASLQATMPPTDTALAASSNVSGLDVLVLWFVGGIAFIATLAFAGSRLNGRRR